MALDTDIDDQDQAETFDEETTEGDGDLESTYPLDRSVLDATTARGDADLDGDDDAADADEESDEALGELDDAGEEDDLDDEGSDVDALSGDDIPDFTPDTDFPAQEGEPEVARHGEDEAEVSAMGDMTGYGSQSRAADFESDTLSDADLRELDYKDAEDDEPSKSKEGAATVRHEDDRLDEGLEETFPASDPVSAKHIT